MMHIFLRFALVLFIPLVVKVFYFNRSFEPKSLKIESIRADITDADGVLLATTIPTNSVYIIPQEISDSHLVASRLSSILNISQEFITSRINSKSRKFAWIIRHVAPWQAKAVIGLGLDGVFIAKDARRFYPHGGLFAHVVGKVGHDNEGVSGVEFAFNSRLKNNRSPLRLSLSTSIQSVFKKTLDEGKKEFSAKAVNGILICAKTGRILASYSNNIEQELNPHLAYDANDDCNINRNAQSVFEMGSILKVVNTAMLIEHSVADLDSTIVAGSTWHFARHTISDFKSRPTGPISLRDAFLCSSNVAHGKFAQTAGIKRQVEFFSRCGFFLPLNIDGMFSVNSIFPKKWREINGITAAYGYGIAITPIHYIQAVLRILSGYNRRLHILQDFSMAQSEAAKIMKEKTVSSMRNLLALSALDGQARRAAVPGYDVGAKTGTANKSVGTKYLERKNRCSLIFAFPMCNPLFIGLITVEEPKPTKETFGFVTAGLIAAPIGARIVKQIAPILGVREDFDATVV